MEQWEADARWSYDGVADAYAAATRAAVAEDPWLGGAYRTLVGLVAPTAGEPAPVVADVGCGPGLWLQRLCELGADAVGVDVSPAMLAHGQALGTTSRLVAGTLTAVPLADGSCDAVACMYVLHHVPDDALSQALDELVRVTRPGGVLMVGGHVGNRRHVKTEGYGGRPMRVQVNRRPARTWSDALADRGLSIEAETVLDPRTDSASHITFARLG